MGPNKHRSAKWVCLFMYMLFSDNQTKRFTDKLGHYAYKRPYKDSSAHTQACVGVWSIKF